jgi:prepilin-type N-terminal cleavage/methylation domain-containing protein
MLVFGFCPRDSRGFGAGMKLSSKYTSSRRDVPKGFSLVELLLSLAVLLVLTAVAIPVVVRSLQSYQLNSVASQFAGMLKFTKFEAIRQNTLVGCQIVRQGSNWFVWVDSNGNGIADGAEPQMVITGSLTLLPEASVPSPAPILASLGPGRSSFLYVVWSGVNASVIYDQRGVLYYPGGVTEAYAYYLGNRNDPNFGYRAIIVLPSGAVQVWTSSSAGDWQRVS